MALSLSMSKHNLFAIRVCQNDHIQLSPRMGSTAAFRSVSRFEGH